MTPLRMNKWLEALLSLVYPPMCDACGRPLVNGERLLCLHCRLSLTPAPDIEPRLASLLNPIERAKALYVYDKGHPAARLVQAAKYNGFPRIGYQLMAEAIPQLQASGFFDGVDAVCPVPLNVWRLMRRSYNQSSYIARAIEDQLDIPLRKLLRARHHASQTHFGATDRAKNAERTYYADVKKCRHYNHILLIDDVITTGATVRACVAALHAANPQAKISVLALTARTK